MPSRTIEEKNARRLQERHTVRDSNNMEDIEYTDTYYPKMKPGLDQLDTLMKNDKK